VLRWWWTEAKITRARFGKVEESQCPHSRLVFPFFSYPFLLTFLQIDEATSALNPTSRILFYEALMRWPQNKTTIVITHDLSQIESRDFIYVLKGGSVVEQSFDTISRPNLNANGKGRVSASLERCWKLNAGQGDSSPRRAPWPISSGSDPRFYGGTTPCPP
jgi:hypothetical protein